MRQKVGYVRVSTGQEAQDTSVEGQIWQMEKAGCDRIITDRLSASSGVRRPGWEELKLLVARNQVETVLISDLSRLARDGSDQEFLEMCHLAGTRVMDLQGVIYENQTVSGLLTTGVLSVVNRVQSRIISVKVRDGLARRREAGFAARGRLPFGYAHENGQVVPCPRHWNAARDLVMRLQAEEMNLYATLAKLPEDFPWRPTTVGLRRWIQNPTLRGGLGRNAPRGTQNYAYVEWGRTQPLIAPDEWQLIRRMLERRGRGTGPCGRHGPRLFSGLIRCSGCGKNLQWHTKPNKNGPGVARYACKRPGCEFCGRGLREDVVKAAVIAKLVARAVPRMARLAQEGAMPASVECPELLAHRDRLAQLEKLQADGVIGLGMSICRLRDEIAALQGIMPDDWLPFEDIFKNPRALELGSDELLRPVFLHVLIEILYEGGPAAFKVRLRNF